MSLVFPPYPSAPPAVDRGDADEVTAGRDAAERDVADGLPVLDRAALDAQTGGDADLGREVLGLFAGQCRALLPRLLDPALSDPARADLAHTLKGSAAGVGALRVQALAGAAEDALRAGRAPALDGLAAAVAAALAEAARDGDGPG